MVFKIILSVIGGIFVIFGATLFILYLRSPERRWHGRVGVRLRQILARLQAERTALQRLPAKLSEERSRLEELALYRSLSVLTIDDLRSFSGIGPGTVDKLRAGGFSSISRLRNTTINIPGLGEKRVADIRSAVQLLTEQELQKLRDAESSEGRALAFERQTLDSKSRTESAAIQSRITAGEEARDLLRQLNAAGGHISFINYLFGGKNGSLVPPHILQTPLPDVKSVFATKAPEPLPVKAQTQRQPSQIPPTAPALSKVPRESTRPYFVGPGQSAWVMDVELHEPLIYVADRERLDGFDASLLCLRRRFASPRPETKGALGYWPKLEELQPWQAGAYVRWLAGGRQDPSIDIGYVFLYFYGLERRVLVDNQDVVPVAYEVLRLLSIYGRNRSFRSYATHLVCFLAMIGRIRTSEKLISKLLSLQDLRLEDTLVSVMAGVLAATESPLPVDWALRLAAQDERARRSVVLDQANNEFTRLFGVRYTERFGAGIVPSLDADVETIRYHAASSSLLAGSRAYDRIPVATWALVHGWREQTVPLVQIWNECLKELKSFVSRKNRDGEDSVAAHDALPEALRDTVDHPLQATWDLMLSECAPRSGSILIPISRLASFKEIGERKRLTLTQSKTLADLAEKLGTPLEPDSRYTGKPYAWASSVAAIRLLEDPVLPANANYQLAGLILELAMEISEADGQTDGEERRVISEFLEDRLQLGANERARLSALMDVLRANRSESGRTVLQRTLMARFNRPQREALGSFLVSIAAATEGISSEERAALRQAFVALGLTAQAADEAVQRTIPAPTKSEVPVHVLSETVDEGEDIPAPETLDLERIRRLREESDAVAKMLMDAMAQPQLDEHNLADAAPVVKTGSPPPVLVESTSAHKSSNELSSTFAGLRPSASAFLSALSGQPQWSQPAAVALARAHGSTLSAMLDEINGWSDENLGDFVVEEGDPLTVRQDLLAQHKGVRQAS